MKGRLKEREIELWYCWFTAQIAAVGHHLLPAKIHVSRKLESEAEPGFKPRHSEMGRVCSKCTLHAYKMHLKSRVTDT